MEFVNVEKITPTIAIDIITALTNKGEEIVRFVAVNNNQEVVCNLLVKPSTCITNWGLAGITDEEYDVSAYTTQGELRTLLSEHLGQRTLVGQNLERILSLLSLNPNQYTTRDIAFFHRYRKANNIVKTLPELIKETYNKKVRQDSHNAEEEAQYMLKLQQKQQEEIDQDPHCDYSKQPPKALISVHDVPLNQPTEENDEDDAIDEHNSKSFTITSSQQTYRNQYLLFKNLIDKEAEIEMNEKLNNPQRNKQEVKKDIENLIVLDISSSYNEDFKEGDILHLKLSLLKREEALGIQFDKEWEGYGIIYRIVVNVRSSKKQVTYSIRVPQVNPIKRAQRQIMFTKLKDEGYELSETIEYKNTQNTVIRDTRLSTLKNIKKIQFTEGGANGSTYKKEQQLESTKKILESIIFSKVHKDDKLPRDFKFFLDIPGLNKLDELQKKIIKDMMSKRVSVVVGPPGTGKTVLLAAIVYNIYKNNKDSKILICSNSNQAVDQAALKIACNPELKQTCVRFITESRENIQEIRKEMDKAFQELSLLYKIQHEDQEECKIIKKLIQIQENLDKKAIEDLIAMRKKVENLVLSKSNIICSTILSSADQRLCDYKFTQVLVDEASQVKDFDILIPILYGCKKLILIGDPDQLGPVFHNDLVIDGPRSMIERLKELKDLRFELINQQRMHPAILKMPNEVFQGGRMVDRTNRSDFKQWHVVPKNLPIAFINFQKGRESSVGNSWVNQLEADLIVDIMEKLRLFHIKAADVAVLSPYRSQISCIRNLISLSQLTQEWVEAVHTIDSFQGKECEVVLISLVRSNQHGNVGFLNNKNRMNVMLTRAKSALIVVGNKDCITQNPLWNKIVKSYEEDKMVYSDFEELLERQNTQHKLEDIIDNNDSDKGEDEEDFM